MFGSEFVGVAELDVFGRNDTWPFGAGAEEPAVRSDDACGVEGVAGDEELHTLAGAEVGADYSQRTAVSDAIKARTAAVGEPAPVPVEPQVQPEA